MGRRDQDVHFLASKEEVQRIHEKMDELGIRSMGAYLRKMALDGYCINLDLQDVKELVSLLRRCSNNLNQYAIEAFSKERNDEYVGRAEEYKAAKSALLEGLGLEHLFDHSHELTPKEKEIWMLFDRVDVAELLARDAFAKGAYMLGAEDREIMLK